jgi:hypothetical protein
MILLLSHISHSIDHHVLGHALHLRQLAFAEECQLWASQPG